ncbi:LacI family DNA-binding transcriptional regulator [Plebeiibacterium marinum]|uniref:LacI family transcriptional regulator n=1 Tax=Plebeiibacterium marinum TaxID=2992111 RepID=A0AAE3SKL0_9BACT|nr:LacI family DNA-binding transcriptional regulator [Plebeiobacterium marinum]MCW3805645.1 LacI family transcriptional regulator [Plebeiobacterium marinum]
MKKVTINDIAKKLGVTPSTISRALADNKRVSLKTREMVKKVAKEMGYQPNLMAASLRKGRSDLVGMIVPRINRHFFSNVISGVEEILNPAGYSLLIMQSHEKLRSEVKAVNSLMQNRVAGIITSISSETDDFGHFQYVVDSKVPLVQFDRVSKELTGAKVVNDNYTGAYLATKKLLESGYRRVAHFGGSRLLKAYCERRRGYEDAVKDYFGKVDEGLIMEDVITREAGYLKVKEVAKEGIDAVFCAGDYSAFGVYEGLKELGISISKEFGVAGFGNEPFAEMIYPTLSSVEQQGSEMGRMVARQMIDAINGSGHNIEIVVPVKYIDRDSSGKVL